MTRDQLLELCAQLSAQSIKLHQTIEQHKEHIERLNLHIEQLDHQLSCEQACMCEYPDDCTGACE